MTVRGLTRPDLKRTFYAALVEGAVIFVGIMGALWADAWWDSRQVRGREASYLTELAEDFDENRVNLQAAIDRADPTIAAAMVLLSVETPAQGRRIGTDSLVALLSELERLPTFEPVTKTFDNIVGAGDLLTLRDRELRQELASFQSRLALMKVVQDTQERQFVELLQPYIIKHLDYVATVNLDSDSLALPSPIHAESVHAVVGTREFRNWVVARLQWAVDLQDQHSTVLESVESIRTMLRQAER